MPGKKKAGGKKSGKKAGGKKSGKGKKGKSAGAKRKGGSAKSEAGAAKEARPEPDMLDEPAMNNLYYIAHDGPHALDIRGFTPVGLPSKKGKKKGGGKKKKKK